MDVFILVFFLFGFQQYKLQIAILTYHLIMSTQFFSYIVPYTFFLIFWFSAIQIAILTYHTNKMTLLCQYNFFWLYCPFYKSFFRVAGWNFTATKTFYESNLIDINFHMFLFKSQIKGITDRHTDEILWLEESL